MSINKKCPKCEIIKNSIEFYKDSSKKEGYSSFCKECSKLNTKQYTLNNKEKIKEYQQKKYQENKEQHNKKCKLNRLQNLEARRQYDRDRQESRKESNRIYRKKYKKERKNIDILFKLKENLRNRLYYALKAKRWNKTSHFNEYIGCSQEVFLNHLKSQFYSEICWENYGKVWHIDHIIPLTIAKTEEEIYKLSHYTNLQPILIEDHLEKTFNEDIKLRKNQCQSL